MGSAQIFCCFKPIHSPRNIQSLPDSRLTKSSAVYIIRHRVIANVTMANEFNPLDAERFKRALAQFDEENSRDPNRELADGVQQPKELVYAQWLTDWVLRLSPNASEELRLAARCQHL